MSVEEGTHALADGKQLYTKTFKVWWSHINKIDINAMSRRTVRPKPDLCSSTDSQTYGFHRHNTECMTNVAPSMVRSSSYMDNTLLTPVKSTRTATSSPI